MFKKDMPLKVKGLLEERFKRIKVDPLKNSLGGSNNPRLVTEKNPKKSNLNMSLGKKSNLNNSLGGT